MDVLNYNFSSTIKGDVAYCILKEPCNFKYYVGLELYMQAPEGLKKLRRVKEISGCGNSLESAINDFELSYNTLVEKGWQQV